jgi:hypothetical protein
MKRENLKWAIASVIVAFASGLFIGFVYAIPIKTESVTPKGTKIEYILELQGDTAIVESTHGTIYKCHQDSISSILNQDNL